MKRVFFTLTLAGLLLAGCGRKPNVLILTLDTTRADRLGCYGYTRAATPCLDKLAAGGVLFEHAQSVMPLTLPTHATIFTGLLPIEHGVRLNGKDILPEEIPTLAEIFKASGYRTAAVVASGILDQKYGLGRGFDFYSSGTREVMVSRDANEVTDTAITWLSEKSPSSEAPFFLWAHYYDPHIARSFHRDVFGSRFTNDYDAEVAFMDLHIGRLLDWLEQRGLLENTLVVAVADHGESLGEHGEELHGFFIYQATQHVPLIFKLPGKAAAGRRISGTVSVRDVFPTVLGLADVSLNTYAKSGSPQRTAVDARLPNSFAAAVRGTQTFVARPCHMEALWTYTRFGWAPLSGVVNGGWSYIRAPEPELYDLTRDPGELSNLAQAETRLADERAIELEALDALAQERKTREASISSAEARRLASLGYLSGGRAALAAGKSYATLPDPKRFPGVIKAYAEIISENRRNLSPEEWLKGSQLLASAFPDRALYAVQVGRAYLALEAFDQAIRSFRQVGTNEAEYAEALAGMGQAYAQKKDVGQAADYFGKAYALTPSEVTVKRNYAQCLAWLCREAANKKNTGEAGVLLRRLEEVDSAHPELSALRLLVGKR